MTAVYAILIFLLLIFVHEFGHFLTAKACGVKVNEFSLGMGPAIYRKQKGETLYALRLIPIGGYCSLEGEDEESDDERAFNNKSPWQKILVLTAGALMNVLLCILLMACISFYSGSPTTAIEQISDGSPAQQAGLLTGDVIAAIDGKAINDWTDIINYISDSADDAVTVEIVRGGEKLIKQIPTAVNAEDGRKIIGIMPKIKHDPLASLKAGASSSWDMTVLMMSVLKGLFTGGVSAGELSGPVGIVAVVNQSVSMGFVYIVYIAALISLNLGIFNLLPFPALDGGRILFVLIRLVTGKAITDEMEGRVHFIGIMLLFALMIYVTWNDIGRFIMPHFN